MTIKKPVLKGNFVLRYLQIFVWGCVMEINEELVMRAIRVTMFCMAIWIMYCMNLGFHMVTFFTAFSRLNSTDITVPSNLCRLDQFDPMSGR